MIRDTAMRRIAALLVIVVGLAACGTKGALYLPPPDNPDGTPAATKKK
jgi:predicted small lipoprotein YifL